MKQNEQKNDLREIKLKEYVKNNFKQNGTSAKNCSAGHKATADKRKADQAYAYYSRILNKPFDSVEELTVAEELYYAEQKAKADSIAAKKANALKVEEAFKALNTARKSYKEDLAQLVTEYQEELARVKKAFELGKSDVRNRLAKAEEDYDAALKAFTEKYPEGFHLTLKDGDFETTIDKKTSITENKDRFMDIFELFYRI